MKTVIISSVPLFSTVSFPYETSITGQIIFSKLSSLFPSASDISSSIQEHSFLTNQSIPIQSSDVFESDILFLQFHLRLRGGKQGAFGQKLKKAKATSKKITSLSNCKDLSGRRIGDLKVAKALAEWEAKQQEKRATKLDPELQRERQLQQARKRVNLDSFDQTVKDAMTGVEESMEMCLNSTESSSADELSQSQEQKQPTSPPPSTSQPPTSPTPESVSQDSFAFDNFSFD